MRAGAAAERQARPLKGGRAAAVPVALFTWAVWAAWVAGGAGGCGRGEVARPGDDVEELAAASPPRTFTSGSRLRARSYRVGDVDVLRDFVDSDLGETCSFESAVGPYAGPGPTWMCVPTASALHREGSGPYADRACEVPVAAAPLGGAPASWAVTIPRDACARGPSMHRVLPPTTQRPYFHDGERCVRGAEANVLYPLGEPVPGTSFVQAREENVARGGRIDARTLVAEDGTRVLVGGFDRERGEVVRADADADGVLRWLPSRVAFRNAGAQLPEACASAASKIASSALCPLTAALVLEGACGSGTYHALGAPLACVEGSLAFEIGPAVPRDAYARATFTDVGASAVRRRAFTGPSGEIVTAGDVIDAATGQPCSVGVAGDGSLRCLPTASELVAYFADETCAVHAFAHPVTGCERDASFPRFVRGAAEEQARVFEVTGEVGTLFELRARDGACVPFTPVVTSRMFAAREVPPDRLPLALEQHE